MKAKVFYKEEFLGELKNRSKTIEVEKNDACLIVREFIKVTRKPKSTYITHIKCGRYDYQWKGNAYGAFCG